MSEPLPEERWLAAFQEGDRAVLEACYRDHYKAVAGAVSRILTDADAETVIHEVFCRLLSERRSRESFRGGNLGAWLTRVATNAALDYRRRYRREVGEADVEAALDPLRSDTEQDLAAKELVDRFRHEHLPPEWAPLFEARFLRGLPQREAAKELGMHRTTLVYREARIRALLERFLRGEDRT